jgi:thiamine biosynthesis lipoprotein
MKHPVLLLLFVSAVLAVAGPDKQPTGKLSKPADKPEMSRAEGSVDTMGSTFSVVAYGEDRDQLQSAVEAALEEARRLDHLLSNYRPESEWSEVNRAAADHPVHVSAELFNLLAACVAYSRQSEGTFDITVGPLMKIWGFYKGSGHMPHRAEVRGAFDHIGYQNLLLDRQNQTVKFEKKGMDIDPGGIGKGYAVDRMAATLKENGIRSALISGAGSSIYAIGNPPQDPQGWKVNIKDPRNTSKSVASVYLKDGSMSTSGSYEKFFYAEGKLWSHIMDPRTGYPSMGMLSVSVVTPKTIDSEAWCKPYYILGRTWTQKHKPRSFRVFMCEDRSDVPCAWLQ